MRDAFSVIIQKKNCRSLISKLCSDKSIWLHIGANSPNPNSLISLLFIGVSRKSSLGIIKLFHNLRKKTISLAGVIWNHRNNVLSRNYGCDLFHIKYAVKVYHYTMLIIERLIYHSKIIL